MEVFWRNGYEGTSLSDLTEAMGINRPSLYAAFGDKESLFCAALQRYGEKQGGYVFAAINLPTAHEVAEAFLNHAVEAQSNPRNPPGCLFVQGMLSCPEETESPRTQIMRQRNQAIAALTDRFKRARREGDLPGECEPAALALMLMAVAQGMAVLSAGRATKAELRKITKATLRSFPS